MSAASNFRAHDAELGSGDDSNDIPVTEGLSFGGAGALKVNMANGDTITIPSGALAAGVIHPLRITRLWTTGTTATDIVLYR